MPEPTGRRERHKRATRQALQAAADRLFAERGYDATTVRDIADAAGVTERTFFRYFAAKEELAIPAAVASMRPFQAAIRARPPSEDAVTALHRAVIEMEAVMRASRGTTLLSLYSQNVPAQVLTRARPRRIQGQILAIETGLAPALRDRLLLDGHPDDELLDFRSLTLARICLALVRGALLQDLAQRKAGTPGLPTLSELLDLAFTDLARGWRRDASDD